jgi:hypothetical protein
MVLCTHYVRNKEAIHNDLDRAMEIAANMWRRWRNESQGTDIAIF